MSEWKNGIVGGGALFCRKKAQAGYAYWGKFSDGENIKVRDCGTAGWYETRWKNDDSKVGYVMRDFVDVNVLPAGLTQVSFYPAKAVEYADHHSQTTANGKLCTNRNKTFGSATSNDCANFVSQCLCAGGLPMFNGWSYALPGIPAGWKKTTKWSLTESGMKKLSSSAREWITLIDPSSVKAGDIIYTYNKNNAEGKKYTHVTIAVTNASGGKCQVCGHTYNQNHVDKVLDPEKVRCYRVKTTIKLVGNERRVKLPLGEAESGAEVLDQ